MSATFPELRRAPSRAALSLGKPCRAIEKGCRAAAKGTRCVQKTCVEPDLGFFLRAARNIFCLTLYYLRVPPQVLLRIYNA